MSMGIRGLALPVTVLTFFLVAGTPVTAQHFDPDAEPPPVLPDDPDPEDPHPWEPPDNPLDPEDPDEPGDGGTPDDPQEPDGPGNPDGPDEEPMDPVDPDEQTDPQDPGQPGSGGDDGSEPDPVETEPDETTPPGDDIPDTDDPLPPSIPDSSGGELVAGPPPGDLCYEAESGAEEDFSCYIITDDTLLSPVPVHRWRYDGPMGRRLGAALSGDKGSAWQSALSPFLTMGPAAYSHQEADPEILEIDHASDLHDAVEDHPLITDDPGKATLIPEGSTYRIYTTNRTTLMHEIHDVPVSLTAQGAAVLGGNLHTLVMPLGHELTGGFLDAMQAGPEGMLAALRTPAPLAYAGGAFQPPVLDAIAYQAAVPVRSGWSGWISARGLRLDEDASGPFPGWSASGGSIDGGALYSDGPLQIGLAAGVGSGRINEDVTGDTIDYQGVTVGAQARHDFGEWSLRGGIGLGYHGLQTRRLSFGPDAANAEYDMQTLFADIEASRPIVLGEFDLEPFAGLRVSHVSVEGFTESGSEVFDLAGGGVSSTRFTLYAGARIAASYRLAEGATLRPEGRAQLGYDLSAESEGLAVRFVGDDTGFVITGRTPERFSARIGGGIEMALDDGLSGRVDYDAVFAGSVLAHRFSAGLAYRW
ncbi:autotransporter domain-containing protein [Arsenicitalea aurantiaca]|uniref:Autotransporter domain-containing protein n=1 Tax=Arsenicitalea aurantiaca TaxID=1783274 RepID=A0A433XLZ4_9HYPH|nr:autotransporter outer membrane beta-barrel domain-containing protein [Arsenicitalea aurantiaca]RUT35106.1 autotransporter domain-containing protein [Arsenicitalea aurantiaca]